MSALTKLAGGLLGARAARGRATTARRPARRPAAGTRGLGARGGTGTDAAVGRGVRSLLRRGR